MSLTSVQIAHDFHDTYERLAPMFGYTTRPETRRFDPDSPNGKLMVAVVESVVWPRLVDILKADAENERLRSYAEDATEALRLIFPLAKGYALAHRVGSNWDYIERAQEVLERPELITSTDKAGATSRPRGDELVGAAVPAESTTEAYNKWVETPAGVWVLTRAADCQSFAVADTLLKEAFQAGADSRTKSGTQMCPSCGMRFRPHGDGMGADLYGREEVSPLWTQSEGREWPRETPDE